MTTTAHVLVVGAGPTGLTLACELLRRGITCRIVDRLPGPDLRSKGKGLQPRTARRLRDALGDDIHPYLVLPADQRPAAIPPDVDVFLDPDRDAHHRYHASAETLYLIRPDGYIAFRSRPASAQPVLDHLGIKTAAVSHPDVTA